MGREEIIRQVKHVRVKRSTGLRIGTGSTGKERDANTVVTITQRYTVYPIFSVCF